FRIAKQTRKMCGASGIRVVRAARFSGRTPRIRSVRRTPVQTPVQRTQRRLMPLDGFQVLRRLDLAERPIACKGLESRKSKLLDSIVYSSARQRGTCEELAATENDGDCGRTRQATPQCGAQRTITRCPGAKQSHGCQCTRRFRARVKRRMQRWRKREYLVENCTGALHSHDTTSPHSRPCSVAGQRSPHDKIGIACLARSRAEKECEQRGEVCVAVVNRRSRKQQRRLL